MNRIPKPGFLPKTNLLKLPKPGAIADNIPKIDAPTGDMMENMAKNAAKEAEKMQKQVMEYYKMITGNNKLLLRFILIIGIIIVVLIILLYIVGRNNKSEKNVDKLKENAKDYVGFKEENGLDSISSFSYASSYDKVHKRPTSLKDYYILGSYNSCCGGEVFNNWVDLEILENTIKMGPRVLDFEIFSQNGVPMVAASLKNATGQSDSYSKDTLNHLEILDVLDTCKKAFQGIETANSNDLLILNFRIKTSNTAALNTLYDNIMSVFQSQLVNPSYGFGGRDKNVINEDIKKLSQKVIVSVYDVTNTFKETNLFKITHICNNMDVKGMGAMEYIKNYDVQYGTDQKDMIKKNKLLLKMVIPDETNEKENPPQKVHMENGCQISLMRFMVYDTNLKETLTFFSKNKTALVLKPDDYRYKPIRLAKPKPMDPRVKKILMNNS
jgi:hypothetical protein|tara:strand:- start:16568 stop:17887 length:1320 start_codon:yes stop_codon:yes gene_type:complete